MGIAEEEDRFFQAVEAFKKNPTQAGLQQLYDLIPNYENQLPYFELQEYVDELKEEYLPQPKSQTKQVFQQPKSPTKQDLQQLESPSMLVSDSDSDTADENVSALPDLAVRLQRLKASLYSFDREPGTMTATDALAKLQAFQDDINAYVAPRRFQEGSNNPSKRPRMDASMAGLLVNHF